jgi:hypothetical protein
LQLTDRLVGKQGKYVGRIKKYYEGEKLEELQEKYKRNALKQFYEGIRKIRTGFQPRTTMCKNKQGVIVDNIRRTHLLRTGK